MPNQEKKVSFFEWLSQCVTPITYLKGNFFKKNFLITIKYSNFATSKHSNHLMKISYNWIKDFLRIDLPAEKVGELLTDLGLEVEGISAYESVKGGLKGVVVGEVLECTKHPNADKLSLTKVQVGEGVVLPIVCGAPNVAKGQKVAVATIGTTLYDKEGEPFKIKKGKQHGNPMVSRPHEQSKKSHRRTHQERRHGDRNAGRTNARLQRKSPACPAFQR